jgi:hypothetical protein
MTVIWNLSACLVNLSASTLLWQLFNFNIHGWNPSIMTFYNVIERFIAFFMVSLKNVKAKPCSAFCEYPWNFSDSMLGKTCGSLTWQRQSIREEYVKFVVKSAWNLWKFTRTSWNREMRSFTNLLGQHFE